MQMPPRLSMLSLLLAVGCSRGKVAATDHSTVVDTRRISADAEPGNWLSHGRTYDEQRYSPLATIDSSNVSTLGLAWSYELRTPRAASATPIVVDGTMYVTSSWSIVYALDAKTGRELWVFDPKVDKTEGWKACCDVVNRGVAVYEGKVLVGTLDGRLVALDAKSGARLWETLTVDRSMPYTITGAPRVANGLVYIGNGGAEFGVRGYVSAYDVATGQMRWRFYTVPGDPSKKDGAASDSILATVTSTWKGEWWKYGGGGTAWDAIVYDAAFDQLIVGVGNGSPWNQEMRSPGGGDNLFLSSILALDARTGAYKWHYQTTPGETWDYTATQPIVLAELPIAGKATKVAMQAPKNGFFYVLDRSNGKLISATPIIPLAKAAGQPAGAPVSWAYGFDSTTGRPLENPEARYRKSSALVRPGPFGAHNWHPMSFSPQTGLVYVPAQDLMYPYADAQQYAMAPGLFNLGMPASPYPDDPAVRDVLRKAENGALIAWDPVGRREVWRAPRAGAWNGGTMATASGLVFQGTADGKFTALDARTGRELWSTTTNIPMLAGPVTYTVDGEQYVAALGGRGSIYFMVNGGVALPTDAPPPNGHVYAFKLGGKSAMPAIPGAAEPPPAPPVVASSDAEIAKAATLYGGMCFRCHGVAALGTGVVPDLRHSQVLADSALWARIVVHGERAERGMQGFTPYLTARDAEAMRAYVAREAQRERTARERPVANR